MANKVETYNQPRSYDDAVAWLRDHGFDEDVVIGGLLHDVLEDTPFTKTDVARLFGRRVADIVDGCTEPDHEWGWWEDRKEDMIAALRLASPDVKAVACADKLHNARSILVDLEAGSDVWERFSRTVEWYRRSEAWWGPLVPEAESIYADGAGGPGPGLAGEGAR